MKYIRTYETEEKFLTDKDSTSRGFRLKPTLYKYSEAGDHVHLELDDPRKHGDSTYMEITLDSDVEFSFYICNAPDDTQTTMNCSIDWGDGTIETKTITADDYGFKLVHNYVVGSYKIELYGVERDYSVVGDAYGSSLISHPSIVKRVVLGSGSSIGYCAFIGCTSLTSVYIPEGVTSIEPVAFIGCTSLTSINIPNSVVSIGQGAFFGCSSLTSINIPESVTSIGQGAFGNCNRLTSVTLPNTNNATIHPDAFRGSGTPTIDGVIYSAGTSELTVGNYTFNNTGFLTFYLNGNPYSSTGSVDSVVVYSCDRSKSGGLVIPSTISYNGTTYNVTSIRGSAFSGCSSLTSINIPESVTSIGGSAFEYCSSLTSINIPESVTSIGDSVFIGCSSLTSINIPEGVTSIGGSAFRGCSSLTSIVIPEGVTSIDGSAFSGCSSLTSIVIPDGVTSIGYESFGGCSKLTSINLPSTLTSIGVGAFIGCSSLTSIVIPDGVTSIGNSTFEGCSKLTSINIPEGVTSIGGYMFNGCSSLASINIPEGVTSIGDWTFNNCSSLTSISSLNTTAPTLGTNQVFKGLPTNGTLHIKPGATGYDAWLSELPSGWTIVEDL